MHNLYTQRYNEAVFEVLEQERGAGDAVVFARSATTGGQRLPVHWGGDSTSTFESMAETLRGGLSLACSGFGFWSHDIGGFEGTPDPAVFKRWVAFGLLGTHSRFHGSGSYRVPWAFDEEAVDVTRVFTQLKLSLMPYLYQLGLDASATGVPVMRPMVLEFPDDRAVEYLDRQYMLGSSLLVAPVFTESGEVEFYLPAGRWTNWWTGEVVESHGAWRTEVHGFDTVPLYVREGTLLPVGGRVDRPDYDYLDGLTVRVYPGATDGAGVTVTAPDGRVGTVHRGRRRRARRGPGRLARRDGLTRAAARSSLEWAGTVETGPARSGVCGDHVVRWRRGRRFPRRQHGKPVAAHQQHGEVRVDHEQHRDRAERRADPSDRHAQPAAAEPPVPGRTRHPGADRECTEHRDPEDAGR